jgi:hypothetical protein
MPERKAAIAIDAMMDRSLSDLSAADLLQALSSPELARENTLIADKKKYELWVEESTVLKLSLKDVIEKVRGEKKKVELEIPDWWRWRVNPEIQADYGRLVEDVAAIVQTRVGGR